MPSTCPTCDQPLATSDLAPGEALVCPGCGGEVVVAGPAGAPQSRAEGDHGPPAERPGRAAVTRRRRGAIDHEAAPAGPIPVSAVVAVGAGLAAGLGLLLVAWVLFQDSQRIDDLGGGRWLERQGLSPGTRLSARGSLLYQPATLYYLLLTGAAYVTGALGALRGHRWGRTTLVSTSALVVAIVLLAPGFRPPWTWSPLAQAFFWGQALVLGLPWVPSASCWIERKAADRARDRAVARRSRRTR